MVRRKHRTTSGLGSDQNLNKTGQVETPTQKTTKRDNPVDSVKENLGKQPALNLKSNSKIELTKGRVGALEDEVEKGEIDTPEEKADKELKVKAASDENTRLDGKARADDKDVEVKVEIQGSKDNKNKDVIGDQVEVIVSNGSTTTTEKLTTIDTYNDSNDSSGEVDLSLEDIFALEDAGSMTAENLLTTPSVTQIAINSYNKIIFTNHTGTHVAATGFQSRRDYERWIASTLRLTNLLNKDVLTTDRVSAGIFTGTIRGSIHIAPSSLQDQTLQF